MLAPAPRGSSSSLVLERRGFLRLPLGRGADSRKDRKRRVRDRVTPIAEDDDDDDDGSYGS